MRKKTLTFFEKINELTPDIPSLEESLNLEHGTISGCIDKYPSLETVVKIADYFKLVPEQFRLKQSQEREFCYYVRMPYQ